MAKRQSTVALKRYQEFGGRVFGRWTVCSPVETKVQGKHTWMIFCKCTCGASRFVRTDHLCGGRSISCGCAKKGARKTHGYSQTQEYKIWTGIIKRCENKNTKCYDRYGGRGISMCERWRRSFEAFIADVGPRPSKEHSIDRFPDMNGNYEPGNVRWATRQQQSANRRNSVQIEWNGQVKTLSEWARELHLCRRTIRKKRAMGISVDEIFGTPRRVRKK